MALYGVSFLFYFISEFLVAVGDFSVHHYIFVSCGRCHRSVVIVIFLAWLMFWWIAIRATVYFLRMFFYYSGSN